MEIVWPYIVVFILAAIPLFEVVGIVPVGILAGLAPVPVAIAGFIGNFLTVLLLIILIDKVKIWMAARKQRKAGNMAEAAAAAEDGEIQTESKRSKRAKNLWDKYGLPGLAFIGPLFVGSHVSAFMGMGFGSKRRAVTVWMTLSLVFWTAAAAALTHYGIGFVSGEQEYEGFLINLLR
ncbi:DNA-binding protein [Bacillus lacus]|uniref:DNA-binding protein n=1 Tax=Metabacillus lacus TaxID=1983721 RepID=A0A7X2J0C8_9BACI|nr:small multi-drug export protein [Metabacillus lacus]MRX73110.1 DNA-binding protein [Metabacillus lacus]